MGLTIINVRTELNEKHAVKHRCDVHLCLFVLQCLAMQTVIILCRERLSITFLGARSFPARRKCGVRWDNSLEAGIKDSHVTSKGRSADTIQEIMDVGLDISFRILHIVSSTECTNGI